MFYWAAVPGAPVDQDRSERRALHTGPPVEAWQCVELAAIIRRIILGGLGGSP